MNFIQYLIKNRKMVWELSKKDMKSKYLGSFLGIVWAFIHPIVMILVYWTVFQLGFKSMPIGDIPFVLWLLTGMVPWLFFSESFASATNCIVEYSYLVKKIVFRVSVLPIVKITSSLVIHVFFIFVLFFMFWIYGYSLSIYNIQVIYYLAATSLLVLGLSWITSSLVVFLKDVGQLVAVILQLLFWLTPIFWRLDIVEAKYQFYFKLNPVYYIVEGYRDTFINHKWFWEHPFSTSYFWIVTCIILFAGILLYKKLRSHFADVL